MGRSSTGAYCCKDVTRIELSYLLKKKILVRGQRNHTSLVWTNAQNEKVSSIQLLANWTEDEGRYIRLKYTLTKYGTGEQFDYDYKIYLTSVPSNLGKGEVLYFLCPVSNRRCRVLYRAYGYHKWKSREAYDNRLYYECQLSSKLDYANDRYWKLKRQLDKIYEEKYIKYFYKGKPTKRALRIKKTEEERDYWDGERWELHNLPLLFRKGFDGREFCLEEALVM